MPTFLLYSSEKEKRWRVEVEGTRIFIGRSRQAEVPVPHSSVSKQHVVVERKGGRYVFRDLGSKNGTYLNEFRLDHGPLEDGDELRLGAIRITFYRDKPLARAGPPGRVDAARGDAARGDAARGDAARGDAAVEPAEKGAPPAARKEEAREAAVRTDGELLDLGQTSFFPQIKRSGSRRPLIENPLPAPGRLPPAAAPPAAGIPTAPSEPRRETGKRLPSDAAARKALTSPRRWPVELLLGASAACVCLGLLLGFLGTAFDKPEVQPAADGITPAAGAPPGTTPPGSVETPMSESKRDGAASDSRAEESPFAVLASLKDPETSRRAAVRLCLDVFNRPPTRAELNELLALPHEERWLKMQSWCRQSGPRLEEEVAAHAKRFLGRAAEPEEEAALLSLSGGDPEHYAFLLASSSYYAGEAHRRKRTREQLARSLITDLLNRVPKESEVSELLNDPGLARDDVSAAAKKLASSRESQAGPEPGEDPAAWISGVYSRLLLRPPTPKESQTALDAFRTAKEDAWRAILVLVATHKDYLSY